MVENRHPGTPGGGSGADVKSGRVTAISEGSIVTVTFGTAFSSVPNIVVSLDDGIIGELSICITSGVLVNSFRIHVLKIGGGGNVSRDVAWIATDAGDP